jgi:soluble lytic murein transglycosylase-like protein
VDGGVRDVEEWRPLVELYFPAERVEEALSVIYCESRGDPTAVNPISSAAGLFQFVPNTWGWASAEAGWAGADVFDPEANVAAAAWLVQVSIDTIHPGGAWGHWSCQPGE